MITIGLFIAAIVIFLVGVFWPKRSKRIEQAAGKHLRPAERWADKLRQPFKFLIKSPFWTSRKVAEESSKQGREVRKKIKNKARRG